MNTSYALERAQNFSKYHRPYCIYRERREFFQVPQPIYKGSRTRGSGDILANFEIRRNSGEELGIFLSPAAYDVINGEGEGKGAQVDARILRRGRNPVKTRNMPKF